MNRFINEAIFFSIWVFFHEHSRITGLQGKGEGISLTPHHQCDLGLKLEVTKLGIKNSILKSLLKKTSASFVPGPHPIKSSVKLPHKYITLTLFKGIS